MPPRERDPYLGMCGFLPNFDFPGRSIRFVGVSPQFTAKEGKYAKAGDQYLTFTRAAAVALREFAPDQKVYGQGFVYKVDRYEADQRAMESEKSWGICIQGCTELTDPDLSHCKFCGGELVRGTAHTEAAPLLVEISGVQGLQEKVISDREGRRAYNPMVKEVRHKGIPQPDEAYGLNGESRIHWQLHMTPSAQIRTATILSGVMAEGQEAGTQKMKPLYRELGDENARVFRVRTCVPAEQPEGVRYEAFLLTGWGEGQALLFTLPFDVALEHGWIPDSKDSADQREQFYVTFAHLISRAAIRVLRINKRKGSLQFLNHKINESAGNGSIRSGSRSLMILDSEEGGSGVINILWDYWDQILDEAERLVLSSCCRDKCYSCLMSYDNQHEHPLLNKNLFLMEEGGRKTAPLFAAVKRFRKGELNIHHVEANRELPVDAKSPAEAVLEEIRRKDFGHARETQVSVRRADGREVTRPDFEISSGAGDDVCIFVDGWTYHKLSIRNDVAKRNHLARQHQRVMVLPARLLVPKVQDAVLLPLLQLLKRSEGVQVPCSGGFLGDWPFKTVHQEFSKDISFSGLRPDKWQNVDHAALLAMIGKFLTKEVVETVASLDRRHCPVGYQNGVLLWPLCAEELEQDSSRQAWENVLILHSILAGLGVVNIFVEAKREGNSRVA
jgi:hypothetical protein